MGWTVWELNPAEGKIFHICPDQHWQSCSFLYNGYQLSFPGVKQLGHGVDHPTHLPPRLKKEYSYTYTPPPPPRASMACYRKKLPFVLSKIMGWAI
jgi:hypothetical protein